MKKRISALILAAFVLASLSACGGKNQKAASDGEVKKTTSDSYPLDSDAEISWWLQLQNGVTATASSLNDTEFHDYLEEALGVKINFQHPVAGQETAAANILFNSGNLPDIMEYNFDANYSGGLQGALDDEIVTDLGPYMEAGITPNYSKFIEGNDEFRKTITLEDGTYVKFANFATDPILSVYMAYMIREDLLEKAGLPMPVTIDDWDKALTAFKDMGIKYPLFVKFDKWSFTTSHPFASPFKIGFDFFRDGDTVKYGPSEKNFGEWIKLMKKWYDKGILATDFINIDNKKMTAEVAAGNNGAVLTGIGGQYGQYVAAMKEGTEISYRPATVPVSKNGETPYIHQKDGPVLGSYYAVITSEKNKEVAARVLDYGYSEDGHKLYNFGKEGESYTMATSEDGEEYQKYTEVITNPDKNGGLALAQSLCKYNRSAYPGPYNKSPWYIRQYYPRPEQIEGIEKSDSDALNHFLPSALSMSNEDRQKLNDIMLPIETYVYETFPKMIAGKLSIDELGNYYKELEKLGINDAIAIYQKAYDNYIQK